MRRRIVVGSSSTESCELRFTVVDGRYTDIVAVVYEPYLGLRDDRHHRGAIHTREVSSTKEFKRLLELATGSGDDASVIAGFNGYVR